jgi:hypothetical protein
VVSENVTCGKQRLEWSARVTSAVYQEKILQRWEEKQCLWQLTAQSVYAARRADVEAMKEMRTELRRQKHEARRAQESVVALGWRQRGRRCLEDLILTVKAKSSVQLTSTTSEVSPRASVGDARSHAGGHVKKRNKMSII